MNFHSLFLLAILSAFTVKCYSRTYNSDYIADSFNSVLATEVQTVSSVLPILSKCNKNNCNNVRAMDALTNITDENVLWAVLNSLGSISDGRVMTKSMLDDNMMAYFLINLANTLATKRTAECEMTGETPKMQDTEFRIAHQCFYALLKVKFKPLTMMKCGQLPENFIRTAMGPFKEQRTHFQYHIMDEFRREINIGLATGRIDLTNYGEVVSEIFEFFREANLRACHSAGLPEQYISPKSGSWADQALLQERPSLLKITLEYGAKITKPELIKTDEQIVIIRQFIRDTAKFYTIEKLLILSVGAANEESANAGMPKELLGCMIENVYKLEIESAIDSTFKVMPSDDILAQIRN